MVTPRKGVELLKTLAGRLTDAQRRTALLMFFIAAEVALGLTVSWSGGMIVASLLIAGASVVVVVVTFLARRSWAMLLLLGIAPLEIFALPLPIKGSSGEFYRLLLHYPVSAAIIAGWMAYVACNNRAIVPQNGVVYWSIALALYDLLLLPTSPSVRQSLGYGIIPYWLGVGVFLAVSQSIDPYKDVPKLLKVFMAIGVALAVLGILQYSGLAPSRYWYPCATATFRDANDLARYLIITVLLCMLYFYTRTAKRGWLLSAGAVCVVAVYMTLSRAGWLILFGMLAVLSVARLRRGGLQNLPVIAAGIGFAMVGLWLFFQHDPIGFPRLELLLRASSLEEFLRASGRLPLLLGGLRMFADRPLVGVGSGMFRLAMLTKYYPYQIDDIDRTTIASHTSLVTILAERGIIGLLLTIGLFAAAFRNFRRIQASADPKLRWLGMAVFSGILITIVASQFEGRLFEDVFLWLFLAMLVALDKAGVEQTGGAKGGATLLGR